MRTVILGLGAIGSRVAVELARIYQTLDINMTIGVVDCDRVESKNIINQFYMMRHIGAKKTSAIIDIAGNVAPTILVSGFDHYINEANVARVLRHADLVVDCFDNSLSRNLVASECLLSETPCLHVGMSVGYGGIRWNTPAYMVSDDDGVIDTCTSDLNPGLAQFIAAATVSVVMHYLETQERTNLTVGIENFSVIAS